MHTWRDGGDPLLLVWAAWYGPGCQRLGAVRSELQHAVRRARVGFTELGESGWAAASDWQRYALPWRETTTLKPPAF